jgi:hypothetical protein
VASPRAAEATSDLNFLVERWIDQRTSGRVRSLRVEQVGQRMVVYGHAGSHYVRQLALCAVQEALESFRAEPTLQREVDIQVQVERSHGREYVQDSGHRR